MSSLTVQDYHVGWICALHEELTAAMAMLDEEYDMLIQQDPHDQNNYVPGRVHQHSVVVACMPEGVDGLVSAANVARDMARTFPALRVGLMVGIGGGIPNLAKGIDIRLGDVVVSAPRKQHGGVVQFDKGKAESGGQFVVKGQLNQPPALLLSAVAQLRARHTMRPSKIIAYVDAAIKTNPMLNENGFGLPDEPDCFYCSLCGRDTNSSVTECQGSHGQRKPRKTTDPLVHYGVIASGNQVVKDAVVRDRLRDEFGAACVEMEAAGLMNNFPCLVVRGICDYADAYKNDVWHSYAAMTAAAYAKELLQCISPAQASQHPPIREVLGLLEGIENVSRAQLDATLAHNQQTKTQCDSEKHSRCHQTFKVGSYEEQKNINPERAEGTCQWVLSHPQYKRWNASDEDGLLWISADPGCGKSVLARSLVDHELRGTPSHSTCYFFFKDNDRQDNLATALCALLHQLFTQQPRLIQHAMPAWEKAGVQLTKDVSELWRILLAATRDNEAHDVTCVVDALDECRPFDRHALVSLLARFYVDASFMSSSSKKGRFKFLVTSRPYDDIHADFGNIPNNLPTIRLRGEDKNDQIRQEIDLVVRIQVDKLAKDLLLDNQIKQQLTRKLLQMEHRTYLWLYLAIDDIAKTYRQSLRPHQAVIDTLPTTVEAAYEKILVRVSEKQQGDVKMILRIIVGARRALTINEMAIALGIATTMQPHTLGQVRLDSAWLEQRIRHWCGLFVFVNHNRIYLIHQTAKEFLLSSNSSVATLSGWKHCLDPNGVATMMTQICITFICFVEVGLVADRLREKFQKYNWMDEVADEDRHIKEFLIYSARYWPYHLRNSNLPINNSLTSKAYFLCSTANRLYNVWFPIFWKITRPSEDRPKMNLTHTAALLGHDKVLQMIWQLQTNHDPIDASDSSGRTALTWACQHNWKNVVRLLLDKGADVNAEGGVYGTALQVASAGGYLNLVQLLLDRGADVNAEGGDYGTALVEASAKGYSGIVQFLLDRNAEVDADAGCCGTALVEASVRGYLDIVQLLLAKGADVNKKGRCYGTALTEASVRGYLGIVQVLHDKGADVNAGGQCYNHEAFTKFEVKGYYRTSEPLPCCCP